MHDPIVLWIGDGIDGRAGADDEAACWVGAAIGEAMANRFAGLKGCGIASAEQCFNIAFNQGNFAVEDVDQFIFGTMPVLDR